MLPSTSERVSASTPPHVNERIQRRTRAQVAAHASARPEHIARRLFELDREWDMERVLEANAAALSLAGLALGLTRHRAWLALPVTVGAFLLQHALQGWCPPLPVIRRLGVRTADEINCERTALKALRGDFAGLESQPPQRALDAAAR